LGILVICLVPAYLLLGGALTHKMFWMPPPPPPNGLLVFQLCFRIQCGFAGISNTEISAKQEPKKEVTGSKSFDSCCVQVLIRIFTKHAGYCFPVWNHYSD
jgi:hypothetical protein